MITKLKEEVDEEFKELNKLLENFDEMDKEVLEVLIVERMIKSLENKILEINESLSKFEEYLKTNDSILTKPEKEYLEKELKLIEVRKLVSESILSIWLKHYQSYKPMESNENILNSMLSDSICNKKDVISKIRTELGVIED